MTKSVMEAPAVGSGNAVFVIYPRRENGIWVFDDDSRGVMREPFVGQINEMIDYMVLPIAKAYKGFRALFSATLIPNYSMKLVKVRDHGSGGADYRLDGSVVEGWLCPCLFKYFTDGAPDEIYVKAEPVK